MKGKTYGLPERLPPIEVTKTSEQAFDVDCRELRWMFITPDVGREYAWGIYDAPDWTLTNLTHTQGIGQAVVHQLPCVQVQSTDWELQDGVWKQMAQTAFFLAEKEGSIDMVATLEDSGGQVNFQSFYDVGFFERWGRSQRRLADRGHLTCKGDGVWELKSGCDFACDGPYAVKIGDQTLAALRCLDLTLNQDNPNASILMEAFITRDGHTLLTRRYNAPLWQIREDGSGGSSWDKRFPHHMRLTVNGITFVHWYDAVGRIAFA